METIWSHEVDKILNVGYPLKDIGVDNWALKKEDALIALEHFSFLKVSVLGGDVYELSNGNIKSTYDNWYCEILNNESKDDFLNRSVSKARKYIKEYQSTSYNSVLFSIVPDIVNP